jgi:hypothetical protein
MTVAFNHLGKLGQLGNQMFQYASTKGIASKLGVPFMVPNHRELFDDGIGNRYTILLYDAFKLTGANLLGTLKTDNYVQEPQFNFTDAFFKLDKTQNYSLHGFFQTEKYFKHIEDEVREDLSFKDEIVETCEDIMGQFDNPISLHVRRGDFIHNSSRHPVLHANYYKKALEMFDDDRQVIIFTNDVEWCKEHPLFEDDRFAVAEGGNQFYDMCLMSMCSDFITANSSFSWWGAWLGNKGGVVCPSGWFGPDLKDNNTEDLFCEDWVVI